MVFCNKYEENQWSRIKVIDLGGGEEDNINYKKAWNYCQLRKQMARKQK